MAGPDADEFERPADTMRKRAGASRTKIWFLITGNRWLVAAVIAFLAFVLLTILVTVGPRSIEKFATTDAIGGAFSSLIIATVTTVTLVLTISQLVLSSEIGPLGEQRERMEGATDFREAIEDTAGIGTTPAEPSRFLQLLIDLAETRARSLEAEVTAGDTAREYDDVVAYTDGVVEHSQEVKRDLDGAEFGSFQLLMPVLNYNYAWKIVAARNLRDRHAESLTDPVDDAFAELIEALRFFGPAREYFKTLYFQWEIINVSRAMLYGAMPALMVAAYVIFVFTPSTVTGSTFGISDALLFTNALYVLSLLPFVVLLAYLLRVFTVAQRTLAIGPFILRNTDSLESVRSPEDPE